MFNVPGVYNYDCSIGNHALNGMVGSITVQMTNEIQTYKILLILPLE